MLQIYEKTYRVFWRGEQIKTFRTLIIEEEETFSCSSEKIEVTWENLEDVYEKIGGLRLPFDWWTFKKGRAVERFDVSPFHKKTWSFYEWKEKLDIQITIDIEKANKTFLSINDIMSNFPSEIAIKYLVERGLSIINK